MESQQSVIVWVNALLIALTIGAFSAQVGRRVFVLRKYGWHAALITLAAISACVFSSCQIAGISFSLGRRQEDVSPSDIRKILQMAMASNIFYFLCNWSIKHALLVFYSGFVRERKYHLSIYFMHFVAFGFGFSSIVANLFQCWPINKAWDLDTPGHCIEVNKFFYSNAIIMVATDIILYIMPVVFTWHLQLRRHQRIGLNCLFALGGMVLAASAIRVWAVHEFISNPDFPWWFGFVMIWSGLENHLAVFVACAPSVKVITLMVFPRLTSSINKFVPKVFTSRSSRSRSRASAFPGIESDNLVFKGDKSNSANSDKFQPIPSITPLPEPVLAMDSTSMNTSRSKSFAKRFQANRLLYSLSPTSLRSGLGEDHHLEENMMRLEEGHGRSRQDRDYQSVDTAKTANIYGDNDIRVEHTVTVEEGSSSTKEERGVSVSVNASVIGDKAV